MTAKKDDKPKRRAPDPIPLIGVRGSSTKISAPKALVAVGAVALATSPAPNRVGTPLEFAQGKHGPGGIGIGVSEFMNSVEQALTTSGSRGQLALAALAGMALFGKAIDRRAREFPIRFGR